MGKDKANPPAKDEDSDETTTPNRPTAHLGRPNRGASWKGKELTDSDQVLLMAAFLGDGVVRKGPEQDRVTRIMNRFENSSTKWKAYEKRISLLKNPFWDLIEEYGENRDAAEDEEEDTPATKRKGKETKKSVVAQGARDGGQSSKGKEKTSKEKRGPLSTERVSQSDLDDDEP